LEAGLAQGDKQEQPGLHYGECRKSKQRN
jgi:hypothetical protein